MHQQRTTGPVLLTGATGFLGMELLARLLEESERDVVTLIRAESQAAADARLRATLASLFDDPRRHVGRVVALRGDLSERGLGLDERSRAIVHTATEIVHGAASVAFDLPLAQSRAVNVAGTRRMLELAAGCHRLRRFTYVSTAYVAGARRGRVLERKPSGRTRFRNAYEQSKAEAEALVQAARDRLPVTIVRPSIVVGDRATGWTSSFNVIYAPLRAFASGAFPLLPARGRSPVDVVTVDYVARATLALSAAPQAVGQTFHLVAGERASTMRELVGLAAGHFERPAPVFLPPLVYRAALHPLLLRRASPDAARLLRRNEVYFPYFAVRLTFDDRAARAILDPLGIAPAAVGDCFGVLVAFAQAANWGRRPPIGRAEAAVLAASPPLPAAARVLRSAPALGVPVTGG